MNVPTIRARVFGGPWFPAVGAALVVAPGACGGDRHEASNIPPMQGTLDAAPPSPASAVQDGPSASSECSLCFGKLTPDLQADLTRRAHATKRCYDLALGRNRGAEGRIVMRVRVGQSGNICSEKVLKDEIGDSEFTACAEKAFEGEDAPLPAPGGGGIDVNVPMAFVPSDAGPDAAR